MIDGYVCSNPSPCPFLRDCCDCEFCVSEEDFYEFEHG